MISCIKIHNEVYHLFSANGEQSVGILQEDKLFGKKNWKYISPNKPWVYNADDIRLIADKLDALNKGEMK